MKTASRIVIACVLLVSLSRCGSPATASDVLNIAREFLDALSLLQQASQLYQAYVENSVSDAKTGLASAEGLQIPTKYAEPQGAGTSGANSNPTPTLQIDLPQVAIAWEQDWNKVNSQTTVLEQKLNDVASASSKYWDALNNVTNSINDSQLRQQEQGKNTIAKQKWDAAYQNAQKQLDRARTLRDRGNDFRKILLVTALRGKLAEYTATLDSIALEADGLLKELENVTEQGKSLLSG